ALAAPPAPRPGGPGGRGVVLLPPPILRQWTRRPDPARGAGAEHRRVRHRREGPRAARTRGIPGHAAERAPRAERGQPGPGPGALGGGSRRGESHRRGRPPPDAGRTSRSPPGPGRALGGQALPGPGGVARPAAAFYVSGGMEDSRLIVGL